jgi:hypothetical protein
MIPDDEPAPTMAATIKHSMIGLLLGMGILVVSPIIGLVLLLIAVALVVMAPPVLYALASMVYALFNFA